MIKKYGEDEDDGKENDTNPKEFLVYIYDIKWDTDGEDVNLPTEMTDTISYNDSDFHLDEVISDWLSDNFGFCHKGFRYEIIDAFKSC